MKLNTPKIITLTTDFGEGSPYVAEMKAVILGIARDANIVDVTHRIAPQNVTQGNYALPPMRAVFPTGTIHIAVVDPGVGSARAILLLASHGQFFIGPDNGVFTSILDDDNAVVRQLDNSDYWRHRVSQTFHGRDIMAPVAAHLACGIAPTELGSPLASSPIQLPLAHCSVQDDGSVLGEVVAVDSFGNLITNIHAAALPNQSAPHHVQFLGYTLPIVASYSESTTTEPVALWGSSDWLEVAVSRGNAQKSLDAVVGTPLVVHFA